MKKFFQNNYYLRYLVAFILLGVAFFVLAKGSYLGLIKKISLVDILGSVSFCFLVALVTSFKLGYLLAKKYQTKIDYFDLVALPYAMNLWGIIFPLHGG